MLKRIGTSGLRKRIWDREFGEGRWLQGEDPKRTKAGDIIEKYLPKGGTLLDLGCSDGVIACTQRGMGQYIGVDVSEVAIQSARRREFDHSFRWVCSDMSKFKPDVKIDVIFFGYSLYYLGRFEIRKTLDRYRQWLSELGVIIVVMDNPKRHRWITNLILRHYNVLEYMAANPVVVVFR